MSSIRIIAAVRHTAVSVIVGARAPGRRLAAGALADGIAVAGHRRVSRLLLLLLLRGSVGWHDGCCRIAAVPVDDSDERGVVLAVSAVPAPALTAGHGRAGVARRGVRGVLDMQLQSVVVVMGHDMAAALTVVFIEDEMRERDVGRAPDRAGARGREDAEVAAPGPAVLLVRVQMMLAMTDVIRRAAKRLAVRPALRASHEPVLVAGFQQDATLFGAVRRRGCEAARDGRQSPFLDVGLDEDEAGLAEVDVDSSRAVGADGREEVLGLEAVDDFLELLAVAGEEDAACPGSVADTDNVALNELGAVRCLVEGLVVAAVACGLVGNRVFVEA